MDPNGIVILEGVEGNVSITAAQGGSAYFNPALPVTRIFTVSGKQRPAILFPESANDGVLNPLPFGHRPITLQGVRSTTADFPYLITSSDESIAKIYQGNKIIALKEGNATLRFDVPASLNYVAAETQIKILPVVRPTKEAWLAYRKNDVRYNRIQSRFSDRLISREWVHPNQFRFLTKITPIQMVTDLVIFLRGQWGLIAWDPRTLSIYRLKVKDTVDGRQGISFIRYKDPLQNTGEDFRYIVERSINLRTWTRAGVVHDSSKDIDLGGEMKRVTFYTEDALRKGGKNFLRIRVYKP